MQPIDNSDLAWLIIADFLADQGKITEAEELRESVNNPETEGWNFEYHSLNRVGSVVNPNVGVGTIDGGVGIVGSIRGTGSRGSVGVSSCGGNSYVGVSIGGRVGVVGSRGNVGVGGRG